MRRRGGAWWRTWLRDAGDLLVALAAVAYVPGTSLWLPELLTR